MIYSCLSKQVHEIGRGTSYNSYLVRGKDKIVIFDTVKNTYAAPFVENVKAALYTIFPKDPKGDEILNHIDILFVLHTEQDHSGSLEFIYNRSPHAEVWTNSKCYDNLKRFFPASKDWRVKVLKDNEISNIGGLSAHLIETPLLHWPDSSMVYIKELKVLLTSDAFGQHVGTTAKTSEEADEDALLLDMKAYYAQVFA